MQAIISGQRRYHQRQSAAISGHHLGDVHLGARDERTARLEEGVAKPAARLLLQLLVLVVLKPREEASKIDELRAKRDVIERAVVVSGQQ